ncbi:MAG: hypothetical protein HQL91_00845 [Magnetococcales bacterium]|nr:hypothetical protein [Magnetococcales bacterium]
MEDENGNDERAERGESSKKGTEPKAGNGKMISMLVGLIVIVVAMIQFMSISQRQMREMMLEEILQQNRAQEAFRVKAQQRRFDTIENNKQADMLESQFKPLEQSSPAH